MRAVCIHEFGGLDKVKVEDVPQPAPGPGQALLRVKAAALNHLDIWVRKGRPGLVLSGPHILGSDAAGVVEQLGPGCEALELKTGDDVILHSGVGCLHCEFCLRGRHSECSAFRIIGFQFPGVFAEYAVVPAVNLFPKPRDLTWEEAASLCVAYVTAWRMLFVRAELQGGETVLIHGIGGGVAVAALQLARLHGADVLVTSSSDLKLDRARSLGARGGINYQTTPEVGAEIKRLTGGRGVDVVIDSAGAATLGHSLLSVRRGGRIVTCGVTTGSDARLNLQQLYWNHISLLGSTMGSLDDMRLLLRAIAATTMRPVIDRSYGLSDAAAAMARMEAGEQMGKIVLQV